MRHKIDAHNQKLRYELAVQALKSDHEISEHNKKTVLGFSWDLQAEGWVKPDASNTHSSSHPCTNASSSFTDLDPAERERMEHPTIQLGNCHEGKPQADIQTSLDAHAND